LLKIYAHCIDGQADRRQPHQTLSAPLSLGPDPALAMKATPTA
jgi:hypothetical protein